MCDLKHADTPLVVVAVPLDNQVGYDVKIYDEDATVGDYVNALEAFAEQTLAPCRGCDGCCHERAPLMLCDYYASDAMDLQQWLEQWGVVSCENGAVDIMIKRDAASNCQYLDTEKKECRNWQARPFVCRTHICLPRTERAEKLRQDLVNSGLDALIVQLATEDPAMQEKYGFTLADYKNNAFAAPLWQAIPLGDVIATATWQALYQFEDSI